MTTQTVNRTDTPELSILIPSYLEEENLRVLLPRLRQVVERLNVSCEIIVIDSSEPLDRTEQVCRETGVFHTRQRGKSYGDAIRSGIAIAKGRNLLFMDADGSHPAEFIPELWQHHEEHDVVIASRYVTGGATENPASLVWMSRILNGIFRLVLWLPCRDVSNGFKLYRASLLKSLDLRCDHFDVVEEMLVKAANLDPGLRIMEVPFVFRKRMFGQTKRNLLVFMLAFAVTLTRLFLIRVSGRFSR